MPTRRYATAALILLLAALAFPTAHAADTDWAVSSPSGALTLTTRLNPDGGLEYQVALGPKTVVGWSALGVTRSWVDQTVNARALVAVDLSTALTFVKAEESKVEEEYTLLVGKRRENRTEAHQLSLTFRNEEDARLRLDLRAYDEGVAFRYGLPGESTLHHWLASELTEFNLGTKGTHLSLIHI